MTQRFPVRDLKAVNQKKPPRMFDLIIGDDGVDLLLKLRMRRLVTRFH